MTLNAGSGFSARLAAHISARADEWEQRPEANPVWDGPRLDVARRLALTIAWLGDDDQRVRLIHGVHGIPENSDAAFAALLPPVIDHATERMAAARAGVEFDGPIMAFGTPGTRWIAEQSEKRLDADVQGWLLAFAVASHAAEWEDANRQIDALRIDLQNASEPSAVIADLTEQIDNLKSEASGMRQRVTKARDAEARMRADLLDAQAEIRKLKNPNAGLIRTPDGLLFDSAEDARIAAEAAQAPRTATRALTPSATADKSKRLTKRG